MSDYNDDLKGEAARDAGTYRIRQKAQDVSRLNLRVDNLKRDLAVLERNLKLKEDKLRDAKNTEESIKRRLTIGRSDEQKREAEVSSLKAELDRFSREIEQAQDELRAKELRLRDEKGEEFATKRELAEAHSGGQSKKMSLKNRLDGLEAETRKAEEDLAGKKLELERAKGTEGVIRRDLSKEHYEAQKRRSVIASLKARLDSFLNRGSGKSVLVSEERQEETKIAILTRRVGELRMKVNSENKEIAALRAALEKLEATSRATQADLSSKEAELRKEQELDRTIRGKIEDTEKLELGQKEEITRLKSELEIETKKLADITDRVEVDLMTKERQEESEERRLAREISELETKISMHSREALAVKAEIDHLAGATESAEARLLTEERHKEADERMLAHEVEELRIKINGLTRERASVKAELDRLANNMVNVGAHLDTEKKREEERTRILEQEIEVARVERDRTKRAIEDAVREISNIR